MLQLGPFPTGGGSLDSTATSHASHTDIQVVFMLMGYICVHPHIPYLLTLSPLCAACSTFLCEYILYNVLNTMTL